MLADGSVAVVFILRPFRSQSYKKAKKRREKKRSSTHRCDKKEIVESTIENRGSVCLSVG